MVVKSGANGRNRHRHIEKGAADRPGFTISGRYAKRACACRVLQFRKKPAAVAAACGTEFQGDMKKPLPDECGRGVWEAWPVENCTPLRPGQTSFHSSFPLPSGLEYPGSDGRAGGRMRHRVPSRGSVVKASSGLVPRPFLMTVNHVKELLTIVNVHGKKISVKHSLQFFLYRQPMAQA